MKSLSEIKEIRKRWEHSNIVGVYFLFLENELVYIGQSINCFSRIMIHSKNKSFDSYSILEMPKDLLDETEIKYIKKYKPKFNKYLYHIYEENKPISIKPLFPPDTKREEQKLLYIDENNRQEELGYYTNPFRGVINAINE